MEKKLTQKEKRALEAEAVSNAITYRMTIVFALLVVGILALIRVTQSASSELWLMGALPVFRIVTGVLFLAAVTFFIVMRAKNTDESRRILTSAFLCGIAGTLFVAALACYPLGPSRIIAWFLATALLFFVYEIYAVDFFLFSVVTVVGAIAASLVGSSAFRGHETPVTVAALAAVLIAIAVVSRIAGNLEKNGTAPFVGKKIIAPAGMCALNAYIGCGAALLAVLGVVCFGHALWFIAALAVVYLIFGIIYTVKLM